MPSPNELHYTIILRTANKISGNSNNFQVALPVALPSFTQYYKVRLVQANIPLSNQTAFGLTERRFLTGGVEVLADFGGRTNSYDSSRASLQSFGFLAVPKETHFCNLITQSMSPVHIISNPRFQNIRVQLKNAEGEFLTAKETNDGTVHFPENGVFTFEFTPIV
jgi:hypothetical protein